MIAPQITIARKSGSVALFKRIAGLTKLAAYVGVPAAGITARADQLLEMAGKVRGKKKLARLKKAATQDVTNAELLFIHTKGSPLKHIPARPVIEPAIENDNQNKGIIKRELAASIKADIEGDYATAVKKMKRAAMAGQNAARKWFTDPANHWAPNTPGTIARKGSSRPLIDTGALRQSIIGIIKEE
jgi:hypothetical protein